MLRASAISFGYDLNIAGLVDPDVSIGVQGGNALLRFVETVLGRSETSLGDVHESIVSDLGPEALVDAAAVLGNFEMMNRVAEGSGLPIPQQAIEYEADMVEQLGLLELIKQ